jgi:nucleotide-binding universal stress UspA family protein
MNNHTEVLLGLADRAGEVAALEWAAREARSRNADLHVVRAYGWSPGLVPWDNPDDRMITAGLRHEAETLLAQAIEHTAAGWPDLPVHATAVEGVPADVIVELGSATEVIVLGSRHLSALRATVLGSVSTAVAAEASVPVIVVNGPPADAAESAVVVIGVDGAPGTGDALAFAFDHASRHGRALHAVFCWRPDLVAGMQWRAERPVPEQADRWLAEAIAGWQDKYPDVAVRRSVVRDHPVAGLVGASHAQDLLVVGAHGRHARIGQLLGSVSQGVLRHATCPVAVVR